MIRNIVLDIGNVLAAFRWEALMEELVFSEDEKRAVSEATVLGRCWPEYDRSACSDEELILNCQSLAPGFEASVVRFFDAIGRVTEEYHYSVEWVRELKQDGFFVYYLSNFGRTSFLKAKESYRFLKEMDGGVLSYEAGSVKPEAEIFRYFERKYQVKPQECLFFDDSPENAAAARACGYRSEVFESLLQAKAAIEQVK